MGSIKKGILGGFSGKVGTVIGANWKGVSYMRGKAVAINNPRTAAQQLQREKIKYVMAFIETISPLVKLGWEKANMSPVNAALQYHIKEAVTTTGTTHSMNFEKVMPTKGPVVPVPNATKDATSGGVNIGFLSLGGSNTDYAHVIAYNPTNGKYICTMEKYPQMDWARRGDGEVGLELTTGTYHLYVFMMSDDKKYVSDAFYAGTFTKA